tara:strand:- start:4989 stop:6266 length:1278 start_codon:yes stop_codon:yes gene_type:complete
MKTFFCPDTKTEWPRCFALVDLVSAFASIEKMDFPELQGRPVVVTNGDHVPNSCIITSCYVCRENFGIKTGMRLKEALELCPDIVIRPSRPYRYAEVSGLIMDALRNDVTCDVEINSIDEAYLDLKPVLNYYGSVQVIADKIRKVVLESSGGLRCSIGISEGKYTAKLVASQNKGKTTIIPPNMIESYISKVPVGEICGIGKRTERYLNEAGVFVCRDLKKLPMAFLADRFGDYGRRLYLICTKGHDPYPIITEVAPPKSMGHGKVLPPKTTDHNLVFGILRRLTERLSERLRRNNFKCDSFTVGFKTGQEWIGAKYPRSPGTHNTSIIWGIVKDHFENFWNGCPLYQVHINAVHLISEDAPKQMSFFDEDLPEKANPLDKIKDEINDKLGRQSIQSATELFTKDANMVPVLAFNFQNTGTKNSL